MDERLMRQIIIDGRRAGKWQYLNEFLKYAISRMAIKGINPSETDFSELKLDMEYYLPKEKYKAISHLCDLLYV